MYQIGLTDEGVARDNPFRDRIVLIGATFAESRDSFPTPHGLMQGVEIHGNILHTLLTRRQIQPIAWGPSLLLQFGLCLAISALFVWVRPVRAVILSVGMAALVVVLLLTMTVRLGRYWFDAVTPVLAIYASGILHNAMERRRIRRSFHQYVGREVADRIYSDDPALKMGIGIHTGPVFAGNVGAPRRTKYTVVGDAANLAARLEGLNRELHTTLLITGDTYAAVKDRVEVKDCGELKVKGRHQAVKVYEVLGLVDAAAGPDGGRP